MSHEASDMRCLVGHWETGPDGKRKIGPSCIKCMKCRQYIRPKHMDDICPVDEAKHDKEDK
mgnify:FL=1